MFEGSLTIDDRLFILKERSLAMFEGSLTIDDRLFILKERSLAMFEGSLTIDDRLFILKERSLVMLGRSLVMFEGWPAMLGGSVYSRFHSGEVRCEHPPCPPLARGGTA